MPGSSISAMARSNGTDNQSRELEAVAAPSGWHAERVYEDAGTSGAKGRDRRPGLDAMLKAINARELDMVAVPLMTDATPATTSSNPVSHAPARL
jgi:DNA invertase Pin-like site-specific DNA recombinase